MNAASGHVKQVIGPVVDVEFPPGAVPEIGTALALSNPRINETEDNLVLEVASHLGENTVRTIAMDTTDGLRRGMPVKNSGSPIRVPVGRKTLGRILNVVGRPVDELGPLTADESLPIHRSPPAFTELSTQVEMFVTGIKVVDLLHRPLNDSLSLLIPDVAERLQQLNETRLSIEPDAAAFAAQRATKEQVRTLRRIHTQLERAADGPAAIEQDIAFHHAVADASGNLIYRLILDSLAEIGIASRLRTIGRIGKQAAVEHHAQVLAAIEARDSDAAREAMRRHIVAAGEDMDLPSLKTRKAK